MAKARDSLPSIASHGALVLPSVTIDSFNVELRDGDEFVGDRASNGAFLRHRRGAAREVARI